MRRITRRSSMAAVKLDANLSSLQIHGRESQRSAAVVEEIDGLIRVYGDGHVERPPILSCVTPALPPDLGITCTDLTIDRYTGVWARLYLPNAAAAAKLPVLVYFHGGGFCVGSAAWSCYHDFLGKLASKSNLVILSINYRLAPENPLPAAYDDGLKALAWLRQQESGAGSQWWATKCNFSTIYLSGDSAGANIAYNVGLTRTNKLAEVRLQGLILIQPFFGGEGRTHSEKHTAQPPRSALTVAASDAYWRMSLPMGANRDHPWCNPMAAEEGIGRQNKTRVMVCVSETDILKDRNVDLCKSLECVGHRVEQVMFKGVGHGFQILSKSPLSQVRTKEMIDCICNFVKRGGEI